MTAAADEEVPSFLGLALSTNRIDSSTSTSSSFASSTSSSAVSALSSLSYFHHEALIAAIAIAFFRATVRRKKEPVILTIFFTVLLAALAYTKKSYELLIAVEIFSYIVSAILGMSYIPTFLLKKEFHSPTHLILLRLISIAFGALLSMGIAHGIFGDTAYLLQCLVIVTPSFVVQFIKYLFPVTEIRAAYDIMHELALETHVYEHMIYHLFFVTCHIQISMGFIGIDFLRNEQHRRNLLIRLDVPTKEDNAINESKQTMEKNGNNSNDKSQPTASATTTTMKEQKQKQLAARAASFQRGAAPFIFAVAFPYMLQIIIFGNINKFAYNCVHDEMHRTIRFRQVFAHDNHLTALATDSPTSPEAYANSMSTVIDSAYEIFNRKLFSLPKILLLPGVMSRQPMLVVTVFPFIFLSDWIKASAVSYMTTRIEKRQKEIQELNAIRTKVEAFDMKNALLLQRSGKYATQFTSRRWENLTVKVQARTVVSDLLSRSKGFFSFMQRNFVFTVLIDLALANLIVVGKIIPAEIFVFSRAIEDAVDMVLMRSRSEAELARMMTEVEKLGNLKRLWVSSKEPNLLRCIIDEGRKLSNDATVAATGEGSHNQHHHRALVLRNLHYNRGTAQARADHIELYSGNVYALTGSNGSGKSTLFRILMSCDTNEKSIDLHPSINLLTPAEPLVEEDDMLREKACLANDVDENDSESCLVESEDSTNTAAQSRLLESVNVANDLSIPKGHFSIIMPSSHVVEISQTFYWPLYAKPIDWIAQEHIELSDREQIVRKVAEELHSLDFFQSAAAVASVESDNVTIDKPNDLDVPFAETTIQQIMSDLQEEKEDWFSDLSGGQKSKVELVRTVFLRKTCPDVLLVDETMAPLDPASKELVMAKLKLFCSDSIIIVIYHTDVGQGKEVDGKLIDCVSSNDFFDKNIHLDKGMIHLRETC